MPHRNLTALRDTCSFLVPRRLLGYFHRLWELFVVVYRHFGLRIVIEDGFEPFVLVTKDLVFDIVVSDRVTHA